MFSTLLPKVIAEGRVYTDAFNIGLHLLLGVAFVLVMGVMLVFIIRFRRSKAPHPTSDNKGSHTLEWIWTVIPTIIFLGVFYFGYIGYVEMRKIPPLNDATVINVTATSFNWKFEYPEIEFNGQKFKPADSNELHLKAGSKYVLNLTAPISENVEDSQKEVLHSFFMRGAGVKADVVPGKNTYVTFTTIPESEFTSNEIAMGERTADIFCTEYCGSGHSAMLSLAHLYTEDGYKNWLKGESKKAALAAASPEIKGEQLYKTHCVSCHGNKAVAPLLGGLFGKTENLEGGGTVKVDEAYLRESILEPKAKIVKGYPPVMLRVADVADNKANLDAVIAFLKKFK